MIHASNSNTTNDVVFRGGNSSLSDTKKGRSSSLTVNTVVRRNWDAHMFALVEQAIFKMTKLPDTHELHLNEDVAFRAATVLGILKDSTSATPPKLINEDGDTVVFTWEAQGVKSYLAVDLADIELKARKLGSQFSAEELLSSNAGIQVAELVRAFGAASSGSVIELG